MFYTYIYYIYYIFNCYTHTGIYIDGRDRRRAARAHPFRFLFLFWNTCAIGLRPLGFPRARSRQVSDRQGFCAFNQSGVASPFLLFVFAKYQGSPRRVRVFPFSSRGHGARNAAICDCPYIAFRTLTPFANSGERPRKSSKEGWTIELDREDL